MDINQTSGSDKENNDSEENKSFDTLLPEIPTSEETIEEDVPPADTDENESQTEEVSSDSESESAANNISPLTDGKETKKIRNKIANKNKLKKWQKILIGSVCGALLVMAVAAVVFLTYKPTIEPKTNAASGKIKHAAGGEDNSLGTAPYLDSKRREGVFNFLSVGCDKASLSTDSIMIVSYDTKNKKVTLAQIPRDSYVQIDGKGGRKINSVFAKGYRTAKNELSSLKKQAQGADNAKLETLCKSANMVIDVESLKKVVAGTDDGDDICVKNGLLLLEDVIYDTFAITLDYSVFIDLAGFKNMVDIIGGVEMNVPRDMDYDDPYQGLFIHLKAGTQTLNGDKAEQFVRFRHGYANADLGRIDAQKLFMTAFIKKLMSSSSISKMPKLVGEFNENVVTDIKLADAVYFGKSALFLDLANINMMTWPGVPKYYNGASYVSLNKPKSLEVVNKYFNVYSSAVPESAIGIFELVKSAPTTGTSSTKTASASGTTAATAEKAITLPATSKSTADNSIKEEPDTNNNIDDNVEIVIPKDKTPNDTAGKDASTGKDAPVKSDPATGTDTTVKTAPAVNNNGTQSGSTTDTKTVGGTNATGNTGTVTGSTGTTSGGSGTTDSATDGIKSGTSDTGSTTAKNPATNPTVKPETKPDTKPEAKPTDVQTPEAVTAA